MLGLVQLEGLTPGVAVVNPSYEAAALRVTGTGWWIASLDLFLAAGMSLDIDPDRTRRVPAVTALVRPDRLTVDLFLGADLARFSWSPGGMSDEFAAAVYSMNCVLVGVTMLLDAGLRATLVLAI